MPFSFLAPVCAMVCASVKFNVTWFNKFYLYKDVQVRVSFIGNYDFLPVADLVVHDSRFLEFLKEQLHRLRPDLIHPVVYRMVGKGVR